MSEYWNAIFKAWDETISTEHEYFIAPVIYTPALVGELRARLAEARRTIEPLRAKENPSREEKPFVDRMRFTELGFTVLESYMAMQQASSELDYKAAIAHGERGLAAREELTAMNPGFTTYKNIGESGAAWWPGEVQQYRDLLARTAGPKGTLLQKTPLEWSFRRDPHDTGLARGWAYAEADLAEWNARGKALSSAERKDFAGGWETLRTDIYLQGQGIRAPDEQSYTGHYWYQTSLEVSQEQAGGKIHVLFPGIFNECWFYLNGELFDHRTYAEPWWRGDYKFEWDVDLGGKLKPGHNLITVRGLCPHHFGGIFRRPFLYRPAE